jgi:hypothetical protein
LIQTLRLAKAKIEVYAICRPDRQRSEFLDLDRGNLVEGVVEEQPFVIGEGPASLIKIMDRIWRLAKDEEK